MPPPPMGVSKDDEVSRKTRAKLEEERPTFSAPLQAAALLTFLRGFSLLPPRSPEARSPQGPFPTPPLPLVLPCAHSGSRYLYSNQMKTLMPGSWPPSPVPASSLHPESHSILLHTFFFSHGAPGTAVRRTASPSRLKLHKPHPLHPHFYP